MGLRRTMTWDMGTRKTEISGEGGAEFSRPQIDLGVGVVQVAARLAASLDLQNRIVLVTSYDERDGVADLAARLAIALARVSQSPVALVDADRSNPSLHKLFNVPDRPGFGELIDERADLASTLHQVASVVSLIPAGYRTGSLPLPDGARVCNSLRDRFRYVVIAGGPLLLAPDSVTLGSLCDGAVLALRAGLRRRDEVIELQRELARLKVRLLGAVLREGK
jgi:succinoglycan biosynthesis transport protein ExoP